MQTESINKKTLGPEFLVQIMEELDFKDSQTKEHSRRVSNLVRVFAKAAGLPVEAQRMFALGALLHDIGKMEIPREVFAKLRSGEPLSPTEKKIIEDHPNGLERLVGVEDVPGEVLACLRYHHEKYDGHGFPEGLHGEKIPLVVRMLAIADWADTLMNDTPTRPAFPPTRVKTKLRELAGSYLDGEMVELFCREVLDKEFPGPM